MDFLSDLLTDIGSRFGVVLQWFLKSICQSFTYDSETLSSLTSS